MPERDILSSAGIVPVLIGHAEQVAFVIMGQVSGGRHPEEAIVVAPAIFNNQAPAQGQRLRLCRLPHPDCGGPVHWLRQFI